MLAKAIAVEDTEVIAVEDTEVIAVEDTEAIAVEDTSQGLLSRGSVSGAAGGQPASGRTSPCAQTHQYDPHSLLGSPVVPRYHRKHRDRSYEIVWTTFA